MSLGAGLPGSGAMPATPGVDGAGTDRSLLHDPRLWVTAGLVAVLAAGWLLAALFVGHPLSDNTVAFLPLGVFLIPVLYASVTFGLGGGMCLAIVSGAAIIPWALASLSRQDALGAWSDLVQAVVLVMVAYFVGRAVRAERQAREVVEISRLDHLLAEVRYRDLFETNNAPILIADASGVVHETNLAADELFSRRPAGARMTLTELLGPEVAATVVPGGAGSEALESAMVEIAPAHGGPPAVYRPTGRVVAIDGEEMYQVVLQDVTEDARRRQRAQAYAADVLRGQEDERRRIAQELHDGPLQRLVHLCRLIDAAAGRAVRGPVAAGGSTAAGDPTAPGDPTAAGGSTAAGGRVGAVPGPGSVPGGGPGTLSELRTTTESVIGEVRRIARGLRPPLLDDLGLRAALERLCDDIELRAGVAASLRVEGELPVLAPPAELTVYRIVQEALSNVDRHAGASTVTIRFWVDGGWLQLRVADDGRGFDPTDPESRQDPGTLGLAGMAERAELVGGRLRVVSRPGGGTTVGAAIPVEGPAPGVRSAPPPPSQAAHLPPAAPAAPEPAAPAEPAPTTPSAAPAEPAPTTTSAAPAAQPFPQVPTGGTPEAVGRTASGAYPLRR
jgi:signal transduction histidine kinase